MTREEAIREARRKLEAGEFSREIVSRKPDGLEYDIAILECGHDQCWSLILDDFPEYVTELRKCMDCAREWIKENTTE